MRFFSKQRGLSLVELMIASTLGIILTAGLVHILLSNKTAYTNREGMARLQEGGRMAHFYLARNIRSAGFQGCSHLSFVEPNVVVNDNSNTIVFGPGDYLKGYEGGGSSWTPSLPANIINVKPDSDVIAVRRASSAYANLTAAMGSASDPITVDDKLGVSAGEILFVTDCETTDIFQTTSGPTTIGHGTPENTTSQFVKAYSDNAHINRYELLTYFLRDTGETNATGQPIFSLYQRDLAGNELPLVDGVEEMRATFGVDNNGDLAADQFLTARAVEAAGDWDKVVSVKINLLMNSIDEVSPQPVPYRFMGQSTTPTDRYLRREVAMFITLRNRTV